MSNNSIEAVLCAMKPRTFYRAKDVCSETEVNEFTVLSALRELAKGQLIDKIKDGRRVIYITNQSSLF